MPTREVVDADPNVVHVSLDAGGVVGRVLINNAVSRAEHDAILDWHERGFDPSYRSSYAGDATDSLGGSRRGGPKVVDRWDLSRTTYVRRADLPQTGRGDADVDSPRRRVAAAPRVPRG